MHDSGDGRQAEGWAAFYAALGRLRQTIERLQQPLKSRTTDKPEAPAGSAVSSMETSVTAAGNPAGCKTGNSLHSSQLACKVLQQPVAPASTGSESRLHAPVPDVPVPEDASTPDTNTTDLQASPDDTQVANGHARGNAAYQHQPDECTQLKQEWLPEDFVIDEQDLAVADPWLSASPDDRHLHGMDATDNEAGTGGTVACEEKAAEYEPEVHGVDDVGALPRTDDLAATLGGDATASADTRPPLVSAAAEDGEEEADAVPHLAQGWPQHEAQLRKSASSAQPCGVLAKEWAAAADSPAAELPSAQNDEAAHDAPSPPAPTVVNASSVEPAYHAVEPAHEQDIPAEDSGMNEWDMLEGLSSAHSSTHVSGVDDDFISLGDPVSEGCIATFDEHLVVLPDPVDDVREDPFEFHAGGAPSTLYPSLAEEEVPGRLRALDKALEIAELLEDCTSQQRIVEAAAWLEMFFRENRVYATYITLLRLAHSGCTFEELQHVIALRQLCQDQGYNLIRRYRGSGGWVAECAFPPPYARILELVRARRDYPVEMMIAEEWLGDWWQLPSGSAGFTSFMEYACIRAGVHVAVDDLPLFSAACDEGHWADHHGWTRHLHLSCPGDRDDPAPPLRHVLPRPRCGRLISLPPRRT